LTDDLMPPLIPREQALSYYPPSFRSGKIALLAITWHHGRIFAHWGDDGELMRRLFRELDRLGLAVIVRMHDRRRYEPGYLKFLGQMVKDYPAVLLKYKDQERDNLLDLTVSDVLISNFSSILNPFYYTGRPSLHIYPVAPQQEFFIQRTWKRGKVRERKVPSSDFIWKLDPEENGGILARSFAQLLEAMETAVRDPDCCREKARIFVQKHMAPSGGSICPRIAEVLSDLAEGV